MNKNFKKVKQSKGIVEYKHSKNDLSILLLENDNSPLATFMITYHVGSRNEGIGYTGSTHLLEHLMFKGSKKFNKKNNNAIWDVLQNAGALLNATTWFDRTNYFELVPSEHLEKAVEIEADRMRNAFIKEEDKNSEMTVVTNEFERGENDPLESLDKNIWSTAYQAHPYHHSTIGWRTDIENVSINRLKSFYDTFYWPNNATVTVIGDFDTKKILKLIDKYFGKIKKSPHEIPIMYTQEPVQEGPRRFEIKRSGELPIIGIAHKTPNGLDNDTYGLYVLDRILSYGKSSRFYKKFIDSGKAVDISISYYPLLDNGLFTTYLFAPKNSNLEVFENEILDEYESIKKNGVSQEELNRVKSQIFSQTNYSRDGSYSVASNLNEAIAIGDWTFYTTFLDKINKINKEEIQKIANKYLFQDNSTTGFFTPKKT